MMVNDMADRLHAMGVAVKATNLFASIDPGTPNTAVVLYEYRGAIPAITMGVSSPTVLMPNLHVMVRGATLAEMDTLAKAVFSALNKFSGEINGTRYLFVRPLSSFYDVGPDEHRRPRAVCDFRVHVVTS